MAKKAEKVVERKHNERVAEAAEYIARTIAGGLTPQVREELLYKVGTDNTWDRWFQRDVFTHIEAEIFVTEDETEWLRMLLHINE